jgi:hypothetical protein
MVARKGNFEHITGSSADRDLPTVIEKREISEE